MCPLPQTHSINELHFVSRFCSSFSLLSKAGKHNQMEIIKKEKLCLQFLCVVCMFVCKALSFCV